MADRTYLVTGRAAMVVRTTAHWTYSIFTAQSERLWHGKLKQSHSIASSDTRGTDVGSEATQWLFDMAVVCQPQNVIHTLSSQEVNATDEHWCAYTSVLQCTALTSIVVMVRVVLNRVSVTLIDGSFFSMDSPFSECHRPICKTHTHTNTHAVRDETQTTLL